MGRLFLVISLFIVMIHAGISFAEPGKSYTPGHKKLIVAVVEDPPMVTKNSRGEWSGFNADLWRLVARNMGVQYEFREVSFGEIEDGLRTGKLDLCAAPLYETADRQQFLDFSTPIGSTYPAVAVLSEKDTHPFIAAAKILFSWGFVQVGLVFVLAILAAGAVFWLMERKQNPDHFGGKPLRGMATGIYWVGSTFVSGICTGVPLRSAWGRLLGLLWILVGAVAFGALTASLASSLIEREQRLVYTYNVNSLKKMNLGAVRGTTYASLLAKMGGDSLLYEKTGEGIEALLAKKIDGFFSNQRLMAWEEKKLKKRISVHLTTLNKMRFAFAFQKNSPLRERVNIALMEVMEGPEWNSLAKRHGLTPDLERIER